MSTASAAFAKLAGILKAANITLQDDNARKGLRPTQHYGVEVVGHLFTGAEREITVLRRALPDLYGDFQKTRTTPGLRGAPPAAGVEGKPLFSRLQLQSLATSIEQVLEVLSHSEISPPQQSSAPARRVFISHGRASDWREVQAYVEKDIGLDTLELAQEANQGRTILAKLTESANSCDSAVIVMTGDDLDAEGQTRARENVIHEIGYFQGRYGLDRVVLLHDEGVSIPSNIQGVVYTPFVRGNVDACFGLLNRELKAMYR